MVSSQLLPSIFIGVQVTKTVLILSAKAVLTLSIKIKVGLIVKLKAGGSVTKKG